MIIRRLETTDAPRPETTALIPQPIITDEAPRCRRCRKKLGNFASRPWSFTCVRCGETTTSDPTLTQSREDAHS